MEHKFCPGCENHCPLDALKCGKGRNFFGVTAAESSHLRAPLNEPKVIALIRRCGKFLHRNLSPEADAAQLLAPFSAEECSTLETLLEKCLTAWESGDRNE